MDRTTPVVLLLFPPPVLTLDISVREALAVDAVAPPLSSAAAAAAAAMAFLNAVPSTGVMSSKSRVCTLPW